MVSIWQPSIDYGLTVSNADESDVLEILEGYFQDQPGGYIAALLSTQFHARMKELLGGKVKISKGFDVTFRTVQQV